MRRHIILAGVLGLAACGHHDRPLSVEQAMVNYAIWSSPGHHSRDYTLSRPSGPLNCITAGNYTGCTYRGQTSSCVTTGDTMGGTMMCN